MNISTPLNPWVEEGEKGRNACGRGISRDGNGKSQKKVAGKIPKGGPQEREKKRESAPAVRPVFGEKFALRTFPGLGRGYIKEKREERRGLPKLSEYHHRMPGGSRPR